MSHIIYWWFGVGFLTCFMSSIIINRHFMSAKEFFLLLGVSLALSFLGFIFVILVLYWWWDEWSSKFEEDDDGKKLYPWTEWWEGLWDKEKDE